MVVNLIRDIVASVRASIAWQHLADLHNLLVTFFITVLGACCGHYIRHLGYQGNSLWEDRQQDLGALRKDGAVLRSRDHCGLGG